MGVSRYWLRLLWDSALFHLIIKKRGRVPASDSFVVKRVAGPGLASDYYFQIRPEQALAAFEAKMEWDELAAYQIVMEHTILQPQKDFSQFVEACFGSFSTQLAKNGPYKVLEKEGQDLIAVLHEKLERRRRDLQTGLSVSVKSKIKLTTADLKVSENPGSSMKISYFFFVITDSNTTRGPYVGTFLSSTHITKTRLYRRTILGKSCFKSRGLGWFDGSFIFRTFQFRFTYAVRSYRYKFQA